MAGNDKILTIAILGGAGVAIYFVVDKQRQTQAAALMASQASGVPVKGPTFLEVATGKVNEAVTAYLNKAVVLDGQIKARGPQEYAAWKAAVKAGQKYYAVKKLIGTLCFETATGKSAPFKSCGFTQLEGY